ncbi:MAG: hypothetical protein PUB98_02035 [Clostridiales bacterium]|nr:hypothetical protein [Clostridiales bacterium]
MKNAIMMLFSISLGIFSLAIAMTVLGRMNRSVELQSNLSNIVENTLGQMRKEEEGLKSEKAAAAFCIAELAGAMETKSELAVDILKTDVEKGVFSVCAIENFENPNGSEGRVKWERTAIWNKREEKQAVCYEVCFYRSKEEMLLGTDCYKRYVKGEGERLPEPTKPMREGFSFIGWRDINDYMADFSQPIEQNLVYYAEWD